MNFNEMNILDSIKAAIADMGFDSPTPIQEKVIPLVLEGKDIIAQAPTGTGKTCAFGIPVINNIDAAGDAIRALILCPTRELVLQIENELKEVLKYNKNIRVLSIFGGQNIERQLAGIRRKPHIIVGTTGRVMDHLRRRTLKLNSLKMLILDEVDEMLNMGFKEDIDVILESIPKENIQTILFSATIPKEIAEISKRYQKQPVTVKTQHEESDLPAINQFYVKVAEADKITALTSLIRENNYTLSLVFCNTKIRVEELNERLKNLGFVSDCLHGDLRQQQRDKAMKKFRSGETQVMVATDVAARGIDVDNIEAVFNFDIPHDEEYYVHRIGRTARAKRTGSAYSFVSDKQMYAIRNLERFTKSPILKAEYSNEKTETVIDKKRFDKAVKIIKNTDLTMCRDFLETQMLKLKEHFDEIDYIDIAAALLLQINQADSYLPAMTMEAEKGGKKQRNNDFKENERKGKNNAVKNDDQSGVKFFINLGTLDKLDDNGLKELITENALIDDSDILMVNVLEKFSFVKVKKEKKGEMESLDGAKFNKRNIVVELSSDIKKPNGGGNAGKDKKSKAGGGKKKDAKSYFTNKKKPDSKGFKKD